MGLFTLFLIALIIGGAFVLRRLGILNAAEAKFARRDSPSGEGATFQVTPARASWLFILFRSGVSAITYYLLVSVLGAKSAPLGAIGFLVWALVTYILFRPLLKGLRHRKPVTISVTSEVLTAGEKRFPLREIAEFNVRSGVDPQAAPVARAAIVHVVDGVPVQAGGTSISADVSRVLHNRQAARCYLLTVRTISGSREEVLCGGLTRRCAEALLQDLSAFARQMAGR